MEAVTGLRIGPRRSGSTAYWITIACLGADLALRLFLVSIGIVALAIGVDSLAMVDQVASLTAIAVSLLSLSAFLAFESGFIRGGRALAPEGVPSTWRLLVVWVIPVVNLFVPLRDLARGWEAYAPHVTDGANQWSSVRPKVYAWWGIWVASAVLTLVTRVSINVAYAVAGFNDTTSRFEVVLDLLFGIILLARPVLFGVVLLLMRRAQQDALTFRTAGEVTK